MTTGAAAFPMRHAGAFGASSVFDGARAIDDSLYGLCDGTEDVLDAIGLPHLAQLFSEHEVCEGGEGLRER